MAEDKVLYIAKDGKIRQSDLEKALIESGLQQGDIVFVHSDISSFGKLGEVKNKEKFLSCILDAFLNVLNDGTIIVPTYTYSFCKNEVFDVKNSRSTVGNFTEFVKNHPSSYRSEDPIFSHAAIGKQAESLLKDVGSVCFGEDSLFDRLFKADGKILNFGRLFDITFLHYIERKFGVNYRYNKEFNGQIKKENGQVINKVVDYYVRCLPEEGKNVEYQMPKLGSELERRGLLSRIALGDSFISLTKARDCFQVGIEMLKNNEYAFLASDPHNLNFKKLPFLIGVLDSNDNYGLPKSLPFVLSFDSEKDLIVQKYSSETEKCLEEAYKKGSILSTNLGQGSFGVRRADDALSHISLSLANEIKNKSFLEVGCADGYLLKRLKAMGAARVLGCEPGPAAVAGARRHEIEIINDFYKKGLIEEKFDCVLSYGVLEHIYDPDEFITMQIDVLKKDGIIFVSVPNCEKKLSIGDICILCHEHWNYFTRNSLKKLLQRCGLKDVNASVGMNDAMIYAWGKREAKTENNLFPDTTEENLFQSYFVQTMKNINSLKRRVADLQLHKKTVGFYGGGINFLEIFPSGFEPRFFDGDKQKHGKYFPGVSNAIESPENLLSDKVDELWIAAIDYDSEIKKFLRNELRISRDINIFSVKDFMKENNLGQGNV